MASAATAGSERIGDLLLKEGLISREQLQKALDEQRQSGTRVGSAPDNAASQPDWEAHPAPIAT